MAPSHTDSGKLGAESRELLDALEKLHPLVLVWGDKFQLLGLSRQASRLLETSPQDPRGVSAVDFFHALATERSRDWVREKLSAAAAPLEDGQAFVSARLDLGSHGDPTPCAYLFLFSGPAGDSQSATFCSFKTQEAPENTFFEAASQHKADDLIHDLRSPLLALIGFARLLNEDYAQILDEPGRRFTRQIVEAASKMKEVLEKFEDSSS